ncbi:hypothetical protein IFM89_012217 [Coptis chinensis]|uniref:RNase H type-1 domain-containing protein n=1 Tax=Coptis chinensis TaxID=261450 RepID=A0A835LR43_9MAGN|nr:hypothetical protein IFM89_012217 [Coptis chinensis]
MPTQDRLVYKKVMQTSSCCVCNNSRENSKHLYFNCSFTKEIWSNVKHAIGLGRQVDHSNKEWCNLINMVRGKSQKAELIKVYICATIGYIWTERNNRRFNGMFSNPTVISNMLLRDMKHYFEVQVEELKDIKSLRVFANQIGLSFKYKKATTKQVRWLLPPTGYIKLNCDGSMNMEDVGYGGMARNEQGHVIFAFSGGGDVHSILFQELKTIQTGISLCIDLGYRRIIVASDSLRAIQIFKDIETSPWQC